MTTEEPRILRKKCATCDGEVSVELEPEDNLRTSKMAFGWVKFCNECLDKQEAEEQELEDQRQESAYRDRLAESNMPDLLHGVTFEDLDADSSGDDNRNEGIEAAKLWASGEIKGLLLSGQVGVGKTRIAGAAANVMLRERPVDWMSFSSLMVQAKAGIGSDAHNSMTKTLLGKRALVLDDIDKQPLTDFAISVLFQAVNHRVDNGLPLLLTTNLNAEELNEKLGEAIYSRVTNYGKAVYVRGRDRREDLRPE